MSLRYLSWVSLDTSHTAAVLLIKLWTIWKKNCYFLRISVCSFILLPSEIIDCTACSLCFVLHNLSLCYLTCWISTIICYKQIQLSYDFRQRQRLIKCTRGVSLVIDIDACTIRCLHNSSLCLIHSIKPYVIHLLSSTLYLWNFTNLYGKCLCFIFVRWSVSIQTATFIVCNPMIDPIFNLSYVLGYFVTRTNTEMIQIVVRYPGAHHYRLRRNVACW